MPSVHRRLGVVALALSGLLFVLYPAVRPWRDETTPAGATVSMASGGWVAAHLFAMLGFVLVPLGLWALCGGLARAGAAWRGSLWAVLVSWLGAGLTLPYYGAEDFGLHAVASKAAAGMPVDLLAVVEATRYNPVAITLFGVGLLLLGVGAVLAAIAVWRSGVLARYSGIPFAVGFALLIPQFYGPAAVRIAHGVLVGLGLAWLAVELWRTGPAPA